MPHNDPRLPSLLDHAARLLRDQCGESLARTVDTLDLRARMAIKADEREALQTARLSLIDAAAALMPRFESRLRDEMSRLVRTPLAEGTQLQLTRESEWAALTLVDDQQVERDIAVGRVTQLIAAAAEQELRSITACMATLLTDGRSDLSRHPLRADVPAIALVDALSATVPATAHRNTLLREIGTAYARDMASAYGVILSDWRTRGIKPAPPAAAKNGARHAALSPASSAMWAGEPAVAGQPGATLQVREGASAMVGSRSLPSASTHRDATHSDRANSGWPSSRLPSGPPLKPGPAEAHSTEPTVAVLVPISEVANFDLAAHRAVVLAEFDGSSVLPAAPAERAPQPQPTDSATQAFRALQAQVDLAWQSTPPWPASPDAGSITHTLPSASPPPPAVNWISERRAELQQLMPGAISARTIELVDRTFAEILVDPRVPPEMARLIARLQFPVLRLSLHDTDFFHSRQHPARQLIDRLASMAMAIEDYTEPAGQALLALAEQAVQAIHSGPFEQAATYQEHLGALEQQLREHCRDGLERAGGVATLLTTKELALRLQHHMRAHLAKGLSGVDTPAYVASFVADIWSQVMVQAAMAAHRSAQLALEERAVPADEQDVEGAEFLLQEHEAVPPSPEQAWLTRCLRIASELILGLKPKAGAQDRQRALAELPGLLRDLRVGLQGIGWSTESHQSFLHRWMPDRSQAFKGSAVRDLDHNLLACTLTALWTSGLAEITSALINEDARSAGDSATLSMSGMSQASLPALASSVLVVFPVEQAAVIGWVADERFPQAVSTQADLPTPVVVLKGAMAQGPGDVSEPLFAPTRPDGILDDSTLPASLDSDHTGLPEDEHQTSRPGTTVLGQLAEDACIPAWRDGPPDRRDRAEPVRGADLVSHLRIGHAYELRLDGRTRRVRLAWRSPAGQFFAFTSGANHEQVLTLADRTVRRACESGRLQAAETAPVLDRASERLSHRAHQRANERPKADDLEAVTQARTDKAQGPDDGRPRGLVVVPEISCGKEAAARPADPTTQALTTQAPTIQAPPIQTPVTPAQGIDRWLARTDDEAPIERAALETTASPKPSGIDRWLRRPD